jgi:hypothetical protein
MTKANKTELLENLRSRLFDKYETEMVNIYKTMREDDFMKELLGVGIITPEEWVDTMDDAFSNLWEFISTHTDTYDI